MTLAEATSRALLAAFAGEDKGRQVLGLRLREYKAARLAFRIGELSPEQWEPIKREFDNMLERRVSVIAEEVKALMAIPDRYACAVRINRVNAQGERIGVDACPLEGTTVIAGRRYCDRHAVNAPRLPVPAGRAA